MSNGIDTAPANQVAHISKTGTIGVVTANASADDQEDDLGEAGDDYDDGEELTEEELEDGEPRKRPKTTRKMSEQQKIERREKNREHAKRSRVRKKIIMESMQDKVRLLYSANQALKDVIRNHLPPDEYLQLVGSGDNSGDEVGDDADDGSENEDEGDFRADH